MLEDIKNENIIKNLDLNNLFLSANLSEINQGCKILKNDFYLDSFNYFPITFNYKTFTNLFKRQDDNKLDHFYTKNFYDNLLKKQSNFKSYENCFLLGSSPSDNYFSNLVYFFPRIFFTNNNNLDLVIHRNLSNKFRNLIKLICNMREINVKFKYLDDDFYKFYNSEIPQFFQIEKSVKILKYFIEKALSNIKIPNFRDKIYIRRDDVSYRKILNESDLIKKLRENNFEIINPNHFEILEQIKIFSNAKIILSPNGSNLSNIIFCKKGTKVIEIGASFLKPYEYNILNRYKNLATMIGLDYSKVTGDSVDVDEHSLVAKKYINEKILNESNYYKNIILKLSDINELVNNL